MLLSISFAILLLLCSTSNAVDNEAGCDWIIDKPIIFNPLRKKLTREYAKQRYGMNILHIKPVIIVIHYTAGQSLKKDFAIFNRVRIHGRKYLKKYGEVNVSAHYLIDRNGAVYKLMPDNIMARHVIGLNHCSIGIENVGGNNLTDDQLKSNAKLIRCLVKKYPEIKYLIGHYEYRRFEGTKFFIEKLFHYRTKKIDPGEKFMGKLRYLLKDINFKKIN